MNNLRKRGCGGWGIQRPIMRIGYKVWKRRTPRFYSLARRHLWIRVGIALLVLISAIAAPAQAAVERLHIPIMLYHHVSGQSGRWAISPQKLEEQLAYLAANGFHTVTMQAYLDAENRGTPLPDKPVVLTFDDGYRDAYENVFPLLKKYGMIGTFYVITGQVGNPGSLTWDQIVEMHRAGMEFGAHTVHHPFLTHLPPLNAFLEILQSRLDLEAHLGAPVTTFAYPYNDHNDRVAFLVRLAGFQGACIVSRYRGDAEGDLFKISRNTVLSGERLKTFALIVESSYQAPRLLRPTGETAP
jgi:peptidoglycan/xylan/chitin deacetylase (PgdA/CDA1 family)